MPHLYGSLQVSVQSRLGVKYVPDRKLVNWRISKSAGTSATLDGAVLPDSGNRGMTFYWYHYWYGYWYDYWYDSIVRIKIHSSCEIEYFVETHLCKLCDTPIARITVVCPH